MRRGFRLHGWLALIVLLALAPCRAADDAPKADADPEKLLDVLENGDFDQRQAAAKKLEALGDRARKALEKAAKISDSLDVRQTAERLLEALSHCKLVIEATDRNGKPLHNIDVEVTCYSFTHDPNSMQTASRTDASGRVVVDKLTPGPHYIYVNWKDFNSLEKFSPAGSCFLKAGENRFTYTLSRRGTIKGRVVGEGNQPIENASIVLIQNQGAVDAELNFDDLMRQAEWVEANLTQTDETGAFTMENVMPGSYRVYAHSETHQHAGGNLVRIAEDETVTVEAPIKLIAKSKKYGAIKVKLLDKNGAPLKDGHLTLSLQPVVKGPEDEPRKQAWLASKRRAVMFGGDLHETTTDENGIAEIKDVPAGKWTLLLSDDNSDEAGNGQYYIPEVSVKAGDTAHVDAKLADGIKVKGRVLTSDGRGPQSANIWIFRENDLQLATILGDTALAENYFSSGMHHDPHTVSMDEQGQFEIPRLPHGTYTFCITVNYRLVGVMHGIKSEGADTLRLKDFKLKQNSGRVNQTLYGTIYLPDGKPAKNMRVTLIHSNGSSTSNCDNQGGFNFEDEELLSSSQVILAVDSYRPVSIKSEEAVKRLDVRLEAQEYGNLEISVSGPDGQPLAGALVTPLLQNHLQGNHSGAQIRHSGRDGRASMKKLAYGRRELLVFLDGYYLPKPVEVNLAQRDLNLSIQLNRGLSLKGVLETPPGVKREGLQLALTYGETPAAGFARASMFTTVDASGAFSFEGLAPGPVHLAAHSRGYVLDNTSHIQISENMPPLTLKLIPSPVLTIDFGPGAAGFSASLQSPGSWRYGTDPREAMNTLYETCDGSGRVEFRDVRPGVYDLTLADSTVDIEASISNASTLIFKGLKVSGDPAQTLKLKLPESKGLLSFQVLQSGAHDWTGTENSMGSLVLEVVGENAVCSATLTLPEMLDLERRPVVTGTPSIPLNISDPAAILMKALPPGEYQMFAWLSYYQDSEAQMVKLSPQPLRKFTIKAGETTSLGDVSITLPELELEKMRAAAIKQKDANMRVYLNQLGREDGPSFQP